MKTQNQVRITGENARITAENVQQTVRFACYRHALR